MAGHEHRTTDLLLIEHIHTGPNICEEAYAKFHDGLEIFLFMFGN